MSRQYVYENGQFVDDWNREHGITDTTEQPAPWLEEPWWEVILLDALNLCYCYDAKQLAQRMYSYLTNTNPDYPNILGAIDDTFEANLVAILACACDFTEHGGNYGGSWITPAGERWCELYEVSNPSDTR